MSNDELLTVLSASKPVKKVKNQKKILKQEYKKARKKFNESIRKFSKSKINMIRRNL